MLKVYLLILNETTVMYTGFDSISLRRLPTDYWARALFLAALVLIIEKSVYYVDDGLLIFGYVHEDVFRVS